MEHRDSAKLGQTLEEIDGRVVATIPGRSADYEWKLTPGSSALLWTDSDYEVLENCQEIRFQDIAVSIDLNGQITTTRLEPETEGAVGVSGNSQSDTSAEQPSDVQQVLAADNSDPEAEIPAPVFDHTDTGGGGGDGEGEDGRDDATITALQEGATRISLANYLPANTVETPVVSKAWAAHGQVELLPDGDLSYIPDETNTARDNITFIVHDGHWSTQVMKIRIENQVPLQELGSQLIPNQFDGMDTHVSLDIGGYLSELLVDGNVAINVSGLPAGLQYNSSRMFIEGVLNSDGSDGQTHTVNVAITTAAGQVLSTQFKWVVQQEKAIEARDALTRAVPPISSQSDAAAAAVLYSVASQASIAARGFSLSSQSATSQGSTATNPSQLDLARVGQIAGEGGQNTATGNEADNLFDLSINTPASEEEEGDESDLQLDDTSPVVNLRAGGIGGPAKAAPKQSVDLDQEGIVDIGTSPPQASNEAPFAGTPTAVVTPEDVGITGIDVLAAAYDPEGDALSISAASAGNGTVSISSSGQLDYTPNPDFNGADVISYTINDGNGNSSFGAVTVNVTPVNDDPVAGAVAPVITAEDTTLANIDVLSAASDIDGDTLSVISASAANGSVAINPDGSLNYTPNADYVGPDTVTYTISDGNGGTDTGTYDVTVSHVNDAPRPLADSGVVVEDSTVVIDILANDTDIDGTLDPASVQITGTPSAGDSLVVPGQGTWSVNTTTGEISFAPIADYDGVVSDISYTVADDLGDRSTPVNVSVTITPTNDAPIATADSDTVLEDGSVTIDVLANDSDIDGILDPASVQIIGTSAPGDSLIVAGEGTWSVNTATGEISFTPEADYDGPVTDISYQMRDDVGALSNPATISVTITPVNDAPVASADSDSVNEDGSVVINILANDTDIDGTLDPASVQITGTASAGDSLVVAGQGTWSVNTTTGAIAFTPEPDYNGPVTDITYTVRDNDGAVSSPATVSVSIIDVNDAPIGTDDSDVVAEDGSVIIDVLANDSDIDGTIDPTTVQITGTSAPGDPLVVAGEGSWTVNPTTGAITFTPEADYDGVVTDITYTVLDDDGAPTGPTTVSVTISGSNDDPVAAAIPDSGTNEDTNLNNIDVLSYVTDVDGDTVTVTGASAANGSVTVNGDGTLNYIPNANYNGTDTITFNLDDGNGGTSVGSLDVIVAPVNDDPDAGSPPLSTGIEDTTLSNIDVLSYASDIDGDVLSVSTASAGNGTVTINPDGTLNYVPDADYNGLDTISYTVDDGNGGTAAGTKFIFVNAVNDPPVANNDSDSVAEDSSVVINVLGNDTDVDGSLVPATVQITGTASAGDPLVMPGEGTWTVNTTTGEITFTPEADYNGPVTDITYTVQDNSGAVSSPATVSVTISAVNDAPVVDLSDVENIVVNGTFSDGISPNWTGWTESGIFDGAGAGANAPAMTQHGTGAIASVTQTGLSGLAAGPGDNGAALVKFDFGWSDHNHESESIQLTLTVAGVDYAQITTSSGVGTTTSVVYLNGATGPATVLTSSPEHDWTYQTVEVNLPASVSNSGDLTFSLQNMNTGGDHTDEASIDNVQVIVDTSNPGDTDNHLNYTAGDPPVDLLDLSSSINDQDGTLLQSARIQLTNAEVGDRLLVDGNIAGNGSSGTVNGLAWSSSISGVTVTIDIIGAATHADYLTALSLLQFENTAGSPTASVRSIDITVNDGIDDSAIAQALVFFGVDPTPPALTDDSANGFEDVPLVIDVLANDSSGGAAIDPTTVQLQDTANAGDPLVVPGEGTWTINPVTGEITFTGEAEYSGIPTPIHYSVSDVNGLRSMLADVNVTIVAVNDPPVATIDSDSVTEDGAVTIDVLINDSDIDGTLVPATVQIVGTSNPGDPLVVAGQGTWTVNPVNGEITFTPEPDYDGPVTDITYTVQDDGGATSNPASVSVTISPVNDAPVAAADSDTVVEDSSVIIDVLANDNDIDGGLMPATVQIVGTSNPGDPLAVPGEGTWTVNLLNGEITFTPEADYTGPVTDISYIVEDNNGTASNPATVSVSISATNDAPVLDLSDYDNAVSNSSFSAGSVGSWTDWVAAGPFASGGVAPNAPAVNFDSVGSTSTLTQSGVTGLSDGPGTNGTAVIQFDLGWNDVPSDGGRSQQLTLSVDGIDYVSLTTPSGPGTTATVNFLNGASGTPASISSSTYLDWTYSTIELNLPAGVSDTADVQFTWENLAGPQAATDDISIDNVKVIVNDLNPNDTDYQVDYQNGNDPISLLDSSASILDSDDTTLQSARILLTFAESGDAFLVGGVPASNGASGTVGGLAWSSTISGGQIEINLTGVGTHATYLAALQQIQFESNSATPVSSTRIVDITVNDGTADSVAAQTFILFDINDAPPDSVNDTAAGFEDTPLVIDVLANDINGDFPIDPTTVHIRGTTNPGDSLVVAGEGTWSVNGSTGEITFTPIAEYSGTPTPIEYTVSDVGGLGSKLAQVSATIAAVNDPPVASSDSDSVTEDGAVIIDVLSNDSDIDGTLVPATVQIVGTSNPGDPLVVAGQGTWSVNPINGEITFTPEPDYDGPVADITYTVQDDGGATSNPAAVSVTITPTNDAPVAVADSDTVFEDSSVIIDVLANDNDIDGTLVPATVQIVGTTNPGDPLAVPGEGTWTVNLATGEITFTPETDYNGPVTNIAYTVNDNSGATSAPTTVSVTITATNDAPVAANDASSGPINTTQTIVVLANDNDIDGDPLQVTSAFALNGSVGVNPDNTLSYTPNLNYFGSDTITYTISDGAGGSDAATVSVTIGGSNMPPMVDLDSTDNTPDQTFADDIETGTYSGSTGSAAWTSNWTEIGEADGPSNGSVRIVNDGGDDALRLTGRAVERELDLSSADTAQLSFDLRRTGDWDEDGRFSVEVSTDGISYTRIYTTTSGGS
ncbi:MAG: tandem-95 repeat protein, partial [Rhizobiaceae bacterium]